MRMLRNRNRNFRKGPGLGMSTCPPLHSGSKHASFKTQQLIENHFGVRVGIKFYAKNYLSPTDSLWIFDKMEK